MLTIFNTDPKCDISGESTTPKERLLLGVFAGGGTSGEPAIDLEESFEEFEYLELQFTAVHTTTQTFYFKVRTFDILNCNSTYLEIGCSVTPLRINVEKTTSTSICIARGAQLTFTNTAFLNVYGIR